MKRPAKLAAAKNLSMDALVIIALTQSLSQLIRDAHLEEARCVRQAGHCRVLAQVPAAEPPEWDKLPDGYQRK